MVDRDNNWYEKFSAGERSWIILSTDDIEKIYELEFKISILIKKMQETDYLSDDDYIYYHKLHSQASQLSNKLVFLLENAFRSWIKLHFSSFSDYILQNTIEEDVDPDEDYAEENVINQGVARAWKVLSDLSNDSSLQDKIFAINYALHIVHHNGNNMVGFGEEEFVPPVYGEDEDKRMGPYIDALDFQTREHRMEDYRGFLQDLSDGDAYIPQWEQEMEIRANKGSEGMNWYKQSFQVNIDDAIIDNLISKLIDRVKIDSFRDNDYFFSSSIELDLNSIISLVNYFNILNLSIDDFENTLVKVLEDHQIYEKIATAKNFKLHEGYKQIELVDGSPASLNVYFYAEGDPSG